MEIPPYITEEQKRIIDNFDINIAELEKVGSMLLVLGYSNFYIGADLDIMETLELNINGYSPDKVTLLGQELVLTVYVCLWIVSMKRYYEKYCSNVVLDEENNLAPYISIVNAYFLSVIANSVRLEGFYAIYRDNEEL